MPHNEVTCIVIDGSGNKWIGTRWIGGLAIFDDSNWTVYDTSNSGLPDNWIYCIAIDGYGDKWIGTRDGGLAKFDGSTWTVYNTSNSGLPSNWINCIAIDGSGNKWIGTYDGGLAKFDGSTWTIYNTSNSGLRDNYISSIAIDWRGNKWIGTGRGGLAVYNEGGVVHIEKNRDLLAESFYLQQNFPNPFNPVTTIKYQIPELSFVTIKVYDVLGSEIAILVNEEIPMGSYEVEFDATRLPSGIYFYRLQAGSFVDTKKMILLK